ncbi:MAG: endonuclease/exonuclease/phosphatase family protein, partial [Actinomycetes bacterium]
MAASAVPARGPATIRVVSYNVRSLRDGRHAPPRVIRACEPDLVCVQEAPRFLRWRARCAALAGESGLVVVTGGRAAAGVLLLASLRARVLHAEDVLLPSTPGLHRRGVALACVEVDGVRLAVGSVHLGLRRDERLRHVPLLLALLDRVAERYGAAYRLLAGDVNEPAGRRTWRALGDTLVDGHAQAPWGGGDTFPSHAPVRRIDGVLAGPGLDVLRC